MQHKPRLITLTFALLPPTIPLLACSTHRALHPPEPATPVAEAQEVAAPHLVPTSGDGNGSTIALASLGLRRLALIADSDARSIRVFDRLAGQELEPTDLGSEPAQLLVMDDGRVLVAMRDKAEVDVLEASPGLALHVTQRIPTADEPLALALTPDKRTILVASGWGHSLEGFASPSFSRGFRADVGREPRAVVASSDGTKAYVAHSSASFVSVVNLVEPERPRDMVSLETADPFQPTHTLAWRHGYSLVRSDVGILAPGMLANTGDTTERPSTYGGSDSATPAQTFEISIVDASGIAHDAVHRTPDLPPAIARMVPSIPCFLPRAAAFDAMSSTLFVVCQGTNRLIGMRTPAGRGYGWNVGKEPTGLALDGETRTALVWSQLSRTISQVPMEGMPDADIKTAQLGGPVDALDPVRIGRELFYRAGDPRISADGRACGSCHPDGRDDGLVWSTPDGPRQTPTLAGRLAGTAPYGWNGSRSTVFKHVTGTLQRLGGTGLDPESMDAVVAYCMAMKPPPRVDREDPALVARGQALFDSSGAGCSSCHIEDGTFTDGNRHNVKSKAPGDPRRKFDTPSLRLVGGTSPYFHDGRFNSLRALLLSNGGDDPRDVHMGHSAQLSSEDMTAILSYLRTL
jgi:hypothetical protein